MNDQNAELFGIIACENEYDISIEYMFMEKMSIDDSQKYSHEIIEICTRFFSHAKDLDL